MKKYLLFITVSFCLSVILAFRFSDGNRWMAPIEAQKLVNPFQPTSEILSEGKYLFKQNCKACHGSIGQGDGLVAATLKSKCADLTSEMVQEQTDGELFYKMSVGRIEMPGFKDILKPKERWMLVHYIRSLGQQELTGFK